MNRRFASRPTQECCIDLAQDTQCRSQSSYRLLRMLASFDMFAEVEGQKQPNFETQSLLKRIDRQSHDRVPQPSHCLPPKNFRLGGNCITIVLLCMQKTILKSS